MQTEFFLNHILTKKNGNRFYRFSNADGKTWLMPARNMQVAMNLYQPSGRNGKLVKRLFPWLHRVPLVRRVIHAERLQCGLKKELIQLLERLFQVKELEFAIFCGTPCVHQKITIQLSKGKRILGYCKLTDNEEVAHLFRGEAKVLEQLNKQGVKGIPQCLYCGETDKGIWAFVQSTVKTQRSQVPHEWSRLQEEFLEELQKKTSQKIKFEESDYCQTLQDLQQHINWLPQKTHQSIVETAINKVMGTYSGKTVNFCAYHADFTPWNMFVESGKLFVFDWEYARLTYPPLLDRYHFFTQTAIFEKHWQGKEIVVFLQSPHADWIDRETYKLYLLDIIARFTLREKGKVEGDVARSMSVWIEILNTLNK